MRNESQGKYSDCAFRCKRKGTEGIGKDWFPLYFDWRRKHLSKHQYCIGKSQEYIGKEIKTT